jgi:hypothetical protein
MQFADSSETRQIFVARATDIPLVMVFLDPGGAC